MTEAQSKRPYYVNGIPQSVVILSEYGIIDYDNL